MARDQLPAVTRVKDEVISGNSCSSATLEELKILFADEHISPMSEDQKPKTKAITQPRSRYASKNSAPDRAGPTTNKKKTKAAPAEILDETKQSLSPAGKVRLATEIVNAALKSLSDTIKAKQAKPRLVKRRSSGATSIIQATQNSNALQSRSVNQVPKMAQKSPVSRRSSTARFSGESAEVIATAECARLAFATLRKLGGHQYRGAQTVPLQLETGMSSLISKLIALGLDDLATKELRILVRRLSTNSRGLEQVSKEKDNIGGPTGPTKLTLAELLRFDAPSQNLECLALIVASQLQVLKLLVSKKRRSTIQAALEHLEISTSYSPLNLIPSLVSKDSSESQGKAAQQLEMVSRLLLSLCPPISPMDDNATGTGVLPHIAFHLQLLSIDATVRWWKISGHQGDVSRELVEPFVRYLRCFSRRSLSPATETYQQAKDAYVKFKTILSDFSPSMTSGSIYLNINKILACIARDSMQIPEALEWMETSILTLRQQNPSGSQLCSVLCQWLTAHTQAVLDKELEVKDWKEMVTMVREACSILNTDLEGDSKDLDELLMSIHGLRKPLLSAITSQSTSKNAEDISWPLQFLQPAVDFICFGIKFLIRFRNITPTPSTNNDHRMQFFHRMAKPTVESILALAAATSLNDTSTWGVISTAIDNCRDFFVKFGHLKESADSLSIEEQFRPSPWVLLSNAYWCIYLHEKKKAAPNSHAGFILQRSIDLIMYRTSAERLAGFLIHKHEKLGSHHEVCGDLIKARGEYALAILQCIDVGDLRSAAKQGSSTSLTRVFDQRGPFGNLSRNLSSFVRVAHKFVEGDGEAKCLMDVKDLPSIERATLAEMQLIILEDIFQKRGCSSSTASSTLSSLATYLLSFYTPSTHPIRRLRVLVRLSYILIAYPSLSGSYDEVLEEQTQDLPEDLCDDLGLQAYGQHLLASRHVCIAFSQKLANMDTLHRCLEQWFKLAKASPTIESLQSKVDDIPQWLQLLFATETCLHMQGYEVQRASVLSIIVIIQELRSPLEAVTQVTNLYALGQQYLRLGDWKAADLEIQKARHLMDIYDTVDPIRLQGYLVSAEYSLKMNSLKKCEEQVTNAEKIFHKNSSKDNFTSMSSTEQCNSVHIAASVCYLRSLLHVERNEYSPALYQAIKGVQLVQRAWAMLERRYGIFNRIMDGKSAGNELIEISTMTENMGKLSVSVSQAPSHPTPPSVSKFWALVPSMIDQYLHLSRLIAHRGLPNEARYYVNQALKTACAAKAGPMQIRCHALSGEYNIQSGKIQDAMQDLERASALVTNYTPSHLKARLQLLLATVHGLRSDPNQEDLAIQLASKHLEELVFLPAIKSAAKTEPDGAQDLAVQLQGTSLKEPVQKPTVSRMKQKTIIKSTRRTLPKNVPLKEVPNASQTSEASYNLLQDEIRQQIILCQASGALRRKKMDRVNSLLGELTLLPTSQYRSVTQKLFEAEFDIRKALMMMNRDPVFCVIHESTISCPSVNLSGRRRSREHIVPIIDPQNSTLQSKKLAVRGSSKAMDTNFEEPLNKAINTLREMHSLGRAVHSSATSHKISDRLGTSLMTLSVVRPFEAKIEVNPGYMTYAKEFGRSFSSLKEISAIQVEKALREHGARWMFEREDMVETIDSNPEVLSFQLFQEHYIDIIPVSWNVISISLSSDCRELCLSKLRSGQAPFILTIPLNRHNPQDSDEELFGYKEGRASLLEIIELANKTTHGTHDFNEKAARKNWWEQRIGLDTRLKELLENIEEIWLGGFRGLFAQGPPHYDLLSRFQQSFYRILDKHLPSRRKRGKSTKSNHAALDSRVLELFIGLGNPNNAEDLDEPTMDLLYFVVDILQFHGERNAYDEIDFDVVRYTLPELVFDTNLTKISIETLDALRHYHEAAVKRSQEGDHHTILILDKALHCFPWESLPCMAGQAISRLTSLITLRNRILQLRQQQQSSTEGNVLDSITVNGNNSAYILNPSTDLVKTQDTFYSHVSRLSTSATNIIGRAPTEPEFQSLLSTNDILLYFGHGSGGQYIRSRKIRTLDKCAVALLMGCSSAKLIEEGQFEPWGMVNDYLVGGSPAVVGTLWDVTDKDIDRWGMECLVRWGLFKDEQDQKNSGKKKEKEEVKTEVGDGSPVKKSRVKGKAMAKALEMESVVLVQEKVSLDQAVALGREKCILKYLNGAAPVMYGVPVSLSF
ncbi:MAG: hypothetical protein MMC33_004557 [Icmadophila ericetorum]|nr:hypothetical protein [Icmadophila ericetorum]